jgi:uncharacterized protein (TIGR00255 family)
MTGFGKGEASGKLGRLTVEVRTVNHRYYDISARIPNHLNQLEDRIKSYAHKYIKRGKVNFFLLYRHAGNDLDAVKLNHESVEKYYRIIKRLKAKFGLKGDIKLSDLLSFPDVIMREEKEYDPSTIWPLLETAMKHALLECVRMRQKEGKALSKDLSQRIDAVSRALNQIERFIPRLVAENKGRMDSKISRMLKKQDIEVDKSRLATEVAIFARQSDVSEEITRAKSHLKVLKESIFAKQEVGRRLDFLLQELQREINTLGAKANHVKISRPVVDIKSEIEKMREQVQNVE